MTANFDAPPPIRRNSRAKKDRPQSLRNRQKQLTRQALLDGARSAFEERGYSDVTIDDITARAGASRATFYLHFTKGEVLSELLRDAFGPHLNDSEEAGHALADLDIGSRAAVRSWIARFVDTWRTNRLIGRAWMEGDINDPEIRQRTDLRISSAVDTLTEIILAARRAKGRPAIRKDCRARAALMDLQLQYFCYHVLVRGLDVDIKAGIDAIADQWIAAIHGTEAE
jgi:AcrR family transcriptional regulator